jgi:hypothetical protein
MPDRRFGRNRRSALGFERRVDSDFDLNLNRRPRFQVRPQTPPRARERLPPARGAAGPRRRRDPPGSRRRAAAPVRAARAVLCGPNLKAVVPARTGSTLSLPQARPTRPTRRPSRAGARGRGASPH